MRDASPKAILLADYQPPSYFIETVDLTFELSEQRTQVTSVLQVKRNPQCADVERLTLHGQDLTLVSVAVSGSELDTSDYELDDQSLTLLSLPASCQIVIVTDIDPLNNTSLEGLYCSDGIYCTQCEAEGFRKITYYLDRPDVMATFTTTIIADKLSYPVLLSNGNLVEQGEREDGKHWVTWHDPFKKPAYLFALVAGQLSYQEDRFTTSSGREVVLRIFVEDKDIDKVDHAMRSLKHSMRWDEQVYGREYDLDIYMIVAVDAFNMGAMENKGLNIFNTSCILAKPETTTDLGYQRVEAVVAHEYFHNWSGNRVTCRDWFQLSLKEGFTVFRDAEFSADMGSRTVKRVEDVALLRTAQFTEDAGPMAHAVRPASYIEISNFYTLTIYEKGAEVVRMLHTLLGPEQFRQASDLYFERHDGQAVTTDDFVRAMADISGRDFSQFQRWYDQAGTPELHVEDHYDAQQQQYRLTFRQSCRPTAECHDKQPYLIPVRMGLLSATGPLALDGSGRREQILEVTEAEQTFVFEGIAERPVPSLLRGFSAPVKLFYPYTTDQLLLLMQQDEDGFNRWEACQQLFVQLLEQWVDQYRTGVESLALDTRLVQAVRAILLDDSLDKAMVAHMLTLPKEAYLIERAKSVDITAIHVSRNQLRQLLAEQLRDEWLQVYRANQDSGVYQFDADAVAQRSLKNLCLSQLSLLEDAAVAELAEQQYRGAKHMTDQMAALMAVAHSPCQWAQTLRQSLLDDFYQQWQQESLVVNQWLMVQATSDRIQSLDDVKALMQHPCFDFKNPNKVRSLIGAFCQQNLVNFHRANGAGYRFLADQVIALDRLNPQIAARLLAPLTQWRRYGESQGALMQAELKRIASIENLSKDAFEVVSKSLSS